MLARCTGEMSAMLVHFWRLCLGHSDKRVLKPFLGWSFQHQTTAPRPSVDCAARNSGVNVSKPCISDTRD